MPRRTTLILGAGASCGYGFPVGSQLRQELLGLDGRAREVAEEIQVGAGAIRAFARAFRDSQLYSIDAFLARRAREYSDIGKKAIAYVLIKRERQVQLMAEPRDDHWYQHLVNQLAASPWEEFDPSWLSIVTFNYDRSFEMYMTLALGQIYGKAGQELLAKVEQIPVVHVYGSLGSPWQEREGFLPFRPVPRHEPDEIDDVDFAASVYQAADRIQVIPEGRDDAPSLREAQMHLRAAERIAFLGFGFDETNVRRLGAPDTFFNPDGGRKIVAATSMGLTPAEVQRAGVRVFGQEAGGVFHNTNCIGLLRHTLILD